MTDQNLLAFGCAVTAIAISGAYVALRGFYWQHMEERENAPQQARDPVTGGSGSGSASGVLPSGE